VMVELNADACQTTAGVMGGKTLMESLWVGVDASNISNTRGVTVGDTSTVEWVVMMLLVWIVVFPYYLY
jgi:hypothetical protein